MKISVVGGSNSALKHSYTYLLQNEGYNLENKAVGGTNSIMGLINILKYNLLERSDCLIFEYFINDINFYEKKINNIDRVIKTLTEIVKLCSKNNKKLLMILNYSKKYDCRISKMYSAYYNFIKKNNICYIDVFDLLYSKFGDNWKKYYQDHIHLSNEGMLILRDEIKNQLNFLYVPNMIETNLSGFNNVKLLKIDNFTNNIKNFKNSFVDINYLEVKKKMVLCFDKPTEILGIEYICDNFSGYIEINNNKEVIQKNALKKDSFVIKKNKSMVSLISMNNKIFTNNKIYKIKIINYNDLDNDKYDKEKTSFDYKVIRKNTFKISSILVTNNAEITQIKGF